MRTFPGTGARVRLGDEVIEAVRRYHLATRREGPQVRLHGERLTDRHDTLRATFEAVLAPIGLGFEDIRAMSIILHSVRPRAWIDEDSGEVYPGFNSTLVDMAAEEIDELAVGWGQTRVPPEISSGFRPRYGQIHAC